MQEFQNSLKKELDAVLSRFTGDIAILHSSRATPALVEDIPVMAYGQRLPLKQVASLSVPDARTILVQPWDTSVLKDIEKAIENARSGFSLGAEETFVRITIPPLSEERRKEMVKMLGKKTEEARITVRQHRDRVQKLIEEAFRAKEISEDEKFRSKEQLQKIINEVNERIDASASRKEQEITSV